MRILHAIFYTLLFLTGFTAHAIAGNESKDSLSIVEVSNSIDDQYLDVYNALSIYTTFPDRQVFSDALAGYKLLREEEVFVGERNILTIVDLSKSSNIKRLWIIDLDSVKILHNNFVAHGRNSGNEFATAFSNIPSSYMSSLGFFKTAETYYGKHGLSLRLDGLEKAINDNARRRAIVIHGADYVSQSFIKKYGRLGRSYGCPSVPVKDHSMIIQTIKNGTCVYIYHPDKEYQSSSAIIPKNKIVGKVSGTTNDS